MSAVLILRQPDRVHLLADSAAYDADGILHSVNSSKCKPVVTVPAAVCATGPADLSAIFADRIADQVSSFDDLIERAETILPPVFETYVENIFGGDAGSNVWLIGWHEQDDRPAAYSIDLWSSDSSLQSELIEQGLEPITKLTEHDMGGGPFPNVDALIAAGFDFPQQSELVPEIHLVHMMEVCRRTQHHGKHLIGGKAVLTTVDRRGIAQRVVHRWPEDKIGERIAPGPIDWRSWRSALERSGIDYAASAGVSRLKRNIMERRTKKAMHRI